MEHSVIQALAAALAGGEAAADPIVERCTAALGQRWRWLRPLALRYLAFHEEKPWARRRELIVFLHEDRRLRHALARHRGEIVVVQRFAPPMEMRPKWPVPPIATPGDLADWLGLTPGELDWFADLKALGYKDPNPKLRHYHFQVFEKSGGSVRLIEAPKRTLKEIQQRILVEILDRVPTHAAAHGFVKGRSVKTFAAPHVGQHVVLRLDLKDFFPSIGGRRVQTLFRVMGYPEAVADLLGGLATNVVPRDVWKDRVLYNRPHLPQGAPTSPALANMCFFRADCRLAGLAESAGARYTRYADDLAFSGGGDFERRVERFAAHVAAIVHEEGFTVHHRKTRVMRRGVRQHLAGVVANERLNVPRPDFDRLKAILTNCVRYGPSGQNREGHDDFRAHLEGRVGWVESIHPARGKRLREILAKVDWG